MESYHVISGLRIKGTEIISEITKESVFEYQGSADGSCGPYSLFMGLKILGVLFKKNLPPQSQFDSRTSVGKFMKKIHALPHLLKDGTYLRDIFDLVNENFSSKLNTAFSELEDNKVIDFVISQLDENMPTITSVFFQSGGHWMLAVGYSCNEKGKPIKLLLLDPSGSKPTIAPWNTIIEIGSIRKGDFPYHWQTNRYNVSFKDALSLSLI